MFLPLPPRGTGLQHVAPRCLPKSQGVCPKLYTISLEFLLQRFAANQNHIYLKLDLALLEPFC